MTRTSFVHTLTRQLALEAFHRSFFLWIPVCFGLGIMAFFTLPDRVSLLWFLVSSVICPPIAFAAYLFGRQTWLLSFSLLPYILRAILIISLGVLNLSLGFLTAYWRTESVARPTLWAPVIGELSGYVLSVEERVDASTRIIVTPHSFDALPSHRIPERVRLTVRRGPPPTPGEFMRMKVRLMPPPGPARPGGYDFARESFFQKIGAVGSVLGTCEKITHTNTPNFEMKARAFLDKARNKLTQRIVDYGGGPGSAVAASLVTGKRGFIPHETNAILRAAGIYHIVSISGLHMVLAAGIFFWTTRSLLALFPKAIAHWPIKKIAAVGGMFGASAYCLFSGAEVATQRALIMTLIMMMAVVFNRPVLSMRNLACAALICLIFSPESLLGPSFQMSFAAVAALIFFGQPFLKPKFHEDASHIPYALRLLRKIKYGFLALIATSFIASAATSPFSAFHFQTFNPLGVIGNALALPIIEPLVMPAAVLGILLLPFGLDPPLWWIMARLMDAVLSLCALIAKMPSAALTLDAFNGLILALFVFSFLWGILWKSSLRWGALLPFSAALILILTLEKPGLYIDRSGAGAALRHPHGHLMILGRPSSFVVEQWLRADGDGREASDPSLSSHGWCQGKICKVPLDNDRVLHLIRDPHALEESCQKAFFIITPLSVPKECNAPHIIDRLALLRRGAMEVYFKDNGPFIRGTHDDVHALQERWHPWRRRPPIVRQIQNEEAAAQSGLSE